MEKVFSVHNNFTYCNITSTFSGIGYILIDVNSIVLSAIQEYSLDLKQCPNKTIFLHFHYLVQNLKKYLLKDLLFFYEFTGNPYLDLAISTLNDGSFIPMSDVKHALDNKRIALALTCLEREKLNNFLSSSGLYIGILDLIIFEVPHAFTIVYNPSSVVDPNATYSCPSFNSFGYDTPKPDISSDFEREFFNFSIGVNFQQSDFIVNEETVLKILHKILIKNEKCYYDGRIANNIGLKAESKLLGNKSEPVEDDDIFDLSIEKPWSGKDLDLIIPPIPERISQRHLANIRKSAMSMYDGKFHYSSVVKEQQESEKPKKVSAKMKKIIEENEQRIKNEKNKVDMLWLKNFYSNYIKIPNLKGKKSMLEKLKINNKTINRKLLLLKIELYSDIWNLEKRSENIDEKVLVPLYLSCLNYVDNYSHEDFSKDEFEFVMLKLVEAGFEATVKEILEKREIELDLPFKTKATSAPNDIDLYFQLKYAGDHLKRTLGTRKDKRVPFDPDKWQVDLLDAVDSNKSAVVSAPTSSGKTFICFYAIEKVLKSSDSDAVIFCLPTKALVNQVTADIYARFNPKNCKTVLQGSLMSDRANEPLNCQVLITIPSMLESLLNSADVSRFRYIIIDEVHKINDSSLGLRIERVIHMAKCPLLLLSATLGNLDVFYNWVKTIESAKGRECVLVTHGERYCELRSYVYTEKKFTEAEQEVEDENDYKDIQIKPALVPLNNMFAYSFEHLKEFGFGNDLHFLPEGLLNIYYFIYMILDQSQKKLIKNLAPKKFFKTNIITKAEVKEYQKHLLSTFESWVQQGILNEDQVHEIHNLLTAEAHEAFNFDTSENYIVENIMKLLNTLKESNMLPVIVFNTDRDFVTRLAKLVYEELENSDFMKKKDKALEKMKKDAKRNRDAEKSKDSWIEDSIASEQMIEPDQRDIKYTYLDPITKLTDYEVKEELSDIKGVSKEILDMTYRGIGIHHSAMNRKYRAAVEILFRKKHIRVLFATETLALGINMPCRTVVFAGDSLELDPMNYKQMSGRAGRRGYDTLGNVVFFGIPKIRVQNLMVSMLPEIQGSYSLCNSSFVSFNIENSLVENPLLSSNVKFKELEKELSNLDINQDRKPNITLDVLDSPSSRRTLVDYIKSRYSFIYPSNYLWDLQISNREFDPSVFLFSLLFEKNVLSWTPCEFMNTVAHLFEVRPVHKSFEYVLAPLPSKVSAFIEKVNEAYLDGVSRFYPADLNSLQQLTTKPLVYIKSLLYNFAYRKNSYIFDFYVHGSSVKIKKFNLIGEGELWQALNNIETFLKSLLYILKTYYSEDDERLKKLKNIYEDFHKKFENIFA